MVVDPASYLLIETTSQTDPKLLTNYFLNPRIRERRSLLTQQLL